jgi:hypothetical protein
MSEHATHAVMESHAEGSHAPAAADLRFEKSELQFFVEDDQYTGRNIGKLLAVTFFVLLGLMSFVAWWTSFHEFTSQDPHQVEVLSSDSNSH